MTGAGNDFVLIDNREHTSSSDWASLAPILCNRRFGIGADGLLVVENHSSADFKMLYYNADGSFGGMCGNGGRCAARFMMDSLQKDSVTFEALDHRYQAGRRGDLVRLIMKDPSNIQFNQTLTLEKEQISFHFIDTGAPHTVISMINLSADAQKEIRSRGITGIGSAIRNHPRFQPKGTNVDFLEKEREGRIAMRTYERGVEDETLACGTGAVASAIVSAQIFGLSSPVEIHTRSGQILLVEFNGEASHPTGVSLTGQAEVVFQGTYKLNQFTRSHA